MLDLSPTKLLIIFVVVVVLLGPKRLPQVARQMGAAWGKLKTMHAQIDSELRKSVPDLPSSQEIVQYARSPRRLLDRLAQMPADTDSGTNGDGASEGSVSADGWDSSGRADSSARPVRSPDMSRSPAAERPTPAGTAAFRVLAGVDTDDPSLN